MRSVAIKEINGVPLQPYQRHPRVLELRLMYLSNIVISEYGDVYSVEFFRNWCELNKINWTLISGILNQKPKIRKLEIMNRIRYRQEVIFMGQVFNMNRVEVAAKYLGVSKTYIYDKKYPLAVEDFLNADWVNELDNDVTVCGVPAYKHEVERFLDTLDTFMEVIGNVSVAKTRL